MLVAAPKAVSASTIDFSCINCLGPTYADYFSGDVVVGPAGTLTVTISNVGGGIISEVYVDAPGDGAGYVLFSLVEGAGVDFKKNSGSPAHLPADNNATPDFETELYATAKNPSPTWGINLGESLGLVLNIPGGLTQDGVDDLFADGTFRFGLHVQALNNGASQSFVSTPHCFDCTPTPHTTVPEPASMLLLGTGLLAVARARLKRNN